MSSILKGTIIGILVLLGILGLSVVMMNISYENSSKRLKNQAEAQRGKIEAVYSNMWSILQEQAGVASEYKDAFKEIYPKLIEGRYSKGDGTLMKWIQESNPAFDASLYKKVMQSIEIQRTAFLTEQERMLDIIREHSNLVTTFPGSFFIDDQTLISYKVISTARAKQAMQTGLDEEMDLFDRKKKK